MGNVSSEVGTCKHVKPATNCTDSCRNENGELLDSQPLPTNRQSSTHPFMNFSNHHDACLTVFGDHQRHCLGKFVDRNDESEETNAMQPQLSKKFLDTETAEQHNAEAITVLLEISSHHFPKIEDAKWVRKNFKRHVLPLMKVCTMPAKSVIFRCSERGTCTYLVADGQLEVHDDEGNVVSTLTRGAMIGDSSMLYDCPRSETVICAETTTLWRLNRSAYYALQKIINSPALSVNAKRLFEVIPEVVVLPLEYKEKLMLRIAGTTFTEGMKLYEEDKCSTRVMVIEDGYVNIHFSSLFLRRSPEEVLRELGISVDLNQCRRNAENQVVTWEDILNHPLSETQLKERDEHEWGNVSASAVALALEALDMDTSRQPRRASTDGQNEIGDITRSSGTFTTMKDSPSPSSKQKNVNMLLHHDQQFSRDNASVGMVDTVQGQSGPVTEATTEHQQRGGSLRGSRSRPSTATSSRRDAISNTRPDTVPSPSSTSSKLIGNSTPSPSHSTKTSSLMTASRSSGQLRQASTGRLSGDRNPHLPSLSPVTLPSMDIDKVSSIGVHRSSLRATSEKNHSFTPLGRPGSPATSPASDPLFSLSSPGNINQHHASSSGVRFLLTPSSPSSLSKNVSLSQKSDRSAQSPSNARSLDGSSRSLSRRDLPPPRPTSSRTYILDL